MDKPNIILITVDQMRGDCLSIAGHPDVKTPYLDTLAAKGIRFENAYTSCPSCIPARASIMTGLGQASHGIVGYDDNKEWNYDTTIASVMSDAGYYTQCVGKMHVKPIRKLLGFHHIELHDGYIKSHRNVNTPLCDNQLMADDYIYWLKNEKGMSADIIDTGIDCNSWVARPWIYEENLHPTNWVVSRSIDFLRRRDRTKPFFLMASFVRPHPPFDAPKCYFDMYTNTDLSQSPIGDWVDKNRIKGPAGRIINSDTGPIDQKMLEMAKVGYYACITHLDHQIGRLLIALNDYGVADNTVIIFTSDHGELLGDHNTYRKVRPYQGSVHIPMIIYGPKKYIRKTNYVSDSIVELRDILPTVAKIGGIAPPDSIDGIDMLGKIKDEKFAEREYLHGEHSGGDISNHFIVSKKDKYIWFSQSGKEQYFDLENDPNELTDLIKSEQYRDRINYLRCMLIKELSARPEGYTDGINLITGRKPVASLPHVT